MKTPGSWLSEADPLWQRPTHSRSKSYDEKVTEEAKKILSKMPGTRVKIKALQLGGEDFSRFLHEARGTFYFLGTKNPAKGCIYPNHSPRFKVDEDVLKFGTASLAQLAIEFTNPKN